MSRKRVLHFRGSDIRDGVAVAPNSGSILTGEIAMNYAAGNETLFVKNTRDEIVRFLSDGLNTAKSQVPDYLSYNKNF